MELRRQELRCPLFLAHQPGFPGLQPPCYSMASYSRVAGGIGGFPQAGIDVEIATDDGSAGHHGLVTVPPGSPTEAGRASRSIVGCGPFSMLAVRRRLVESFELPRRRRRAPHPSGDGEAFQLLVAAAVTTLR